MPKPVFAAMALVALLLAQLALAQATDVTSVDFWKGIASGVGKWLRLMFAIAFWSSVILLVFYAIMSKMAPIKYLRLGALVDLIENVKTVLLGVFVFTASVTGIVAGVAAIANAFGASFGVSPVQVIDALIFKPIAEMVQGVIG